jgi:hypothetical protein
MTATLDPWPPGYLRPHQLKSKWPRAIDPNVVPRAFATEFVEAFYENYEGLAIQDARRIDSVLKTDFFNLGVRISDKALSAMSVCIQLGSSNDIACAHDSSVAMDPALVSPHECEYIEPENIADCLGPLLQEKQRLASDFRLDIFLHTNHGHSVSLWLSGLSLVSLFGVGKFVSNELENIAKHAIPTLEACKPAIHCRPQREVQGSG